MHTHKYKYKYKYLPMQHELCKKTKANCIETYLKERKKDRGHE